MRTVIAFLIGLFLGCFIGITLLSIVTLSNTKGEDENELYKN